MPQTYDQSELHKGKEDQAGRRPVRRVYAHPNARTDAAPQSSADRGTASDTNRDRYSSADHRTDSDTKRPLQYSADRRTGSEAYKSSHAPSHGRTSTAEKHTARSSASQHRSAPQRSSAASRRHNSSHSRRRSFTRFIRGFRFYMLILAVICSAILIYLCISLAKYQKNFDAEEFAAETAEADSRAPQLAFQNALAGMDISDWTEAWYKEHPDHLDKEADVNAFMSEYIENTECTCYKDASYTDAAPVYLLRSGGRDFAVFTMEGSADDWWVSGITFCISGTESGSVSVPEGSTVTCCGKVLDDSYITGDSVLDTDFKYSDSLENPVSYVTYSVSGLISVPEFTVDAPSDDYSITTLSDGSSYLALTGSEADSIRSTADSFIRSLLNYYSQGKNNIDANMASVLSYVPSGSDASNIIRQSYEGVTWRYADNASYTTDPSEVCVLADNCYFVDVTYTDVNSTGETAAAEDISAEAEPSDSGASDTEEADIYRVYFLDLGAGFKIYCFSYE